MSGRVRYELLELICVGDSCCHYSAVSLLQTDFSDPTSRPSLRKIEFKPTEGAGAGPISWGSRSQPG